MLELAPKYKNAPWGGRRLAEELGRQLPDGPVGESWELADFDEHQTPVRSGPHEGASLGELWRQGLLGGSGQGEFPFLLKWLDTQGDLSVQVHPSEEACAQLTGARPKSEAWLIASADPGARILIGHYPGLDAATLQLAARGGTIHKWMYEVHPKPGDMLMVEPGTLHAIGAGYLLLEVQQPSDTTYRVYDWGREGLDGQPRELHLEEAAACVNYHDARVPRPTRSEVVGPTFKMRRIPLGLTLPARELRVLVADTEPLVLRSAQQQVVLQPGDVRVAEVADGDITVAEGQGVWISEP